jgi:DNA polymerase III delta subunit
MPLTVVIAADPLLIDEAVADCAPPNVTLRRWYADELDYDTVFAHLGSGGLFEDRQAFHYVNFLGLRLNKKEQEAFAALLARLPEETTLVCSQLVEDTGKKLSQLKSKREFKQLTELGRLTDLTHLADERKAAAWLARRSRERYGLQLRDRQAADLLVSCAGSLSLADAELRKLQLLKREDKPQPVPDELLRSIISQIPTARFYQVADALLAGRPEAVDMVRNWFDVEGATFRLVAELSRRLLGLRELERGARVQPPFFERQLRQFAPYYRGAKLGAALELLAQLEQDLKTGVIPGQSSADAELSALEVFTARLGSLAGGRPG